MGVAEWSVYRCRGYSADVVWWLVFGDYCFGYYAGGCDGG